MTAGRRYVVLGAGAIGGALAARLRLSGAEVVAVARGSQLEALRRGPIELQTRRHSRSRVIAAQSMWARTHTANMC